MSMTIYWCTIYEDINEIVLHNSFINMLFNQKIWKWAEKKITLTFYLHLVLKGLNFLYKTVLVPSFHMYGCIKRCYFIM